MGKRRHGGRGKLITQHKIVFGDSRELKEIANESIDLMITSPPYPMIEMWDKMFSEQNAIVQQALAKNNGNIAFEEMHKELDKVWREVYRVLRKGGIACINIGDATRKIGDCFKLYPSHARIIHYCMSLGFHILPEILWRKQSNKPNKFMGSGMLPVGAYTTLEHEYILILRKGEKKEFKTEEQKFIRQQSAFFWEERNNWFSDIWVDVKGDKQKLNDETVRERSAAYPFELAYRLISMFSVQGDTVLDPYLGTGTTIISAMASGRNSIGIEIDKNFENTIKGRTKEIVNFSNDYNEERKKKHISYMIKRKEEKGDNSEKEEYINKNYNFPVMTRQELILKLPSLKYIKLLEENTFEVEYT